MLNITRLNSRDANFFAQFETWLTKHQLVEKDVSGSVETILNAIREQGDKALLKFTQRFDESSVKSVPDLEIQKSQLNDALESIGEKQRDTLYQAALRSKILQRSSGYNHGHLKMTIIMS